VAGVSRSHAEPAEKWIDPPGAETPEVAALIDAAAKALERGTPSSVLCDARFAAIHAYPRFRATIATHATTAPLTIVAKDEPGERVVLTLETAPGALVYLYQTSAKGWYSDKAHHIRAHGGDQHHARLFGYVRADNSGVAVINTIRPAGYPGTDLPEHFHIEAGNRVTEILFAKANPVKDGATWRIRAAIK